MVGLLTYMVIKFLGELLDYWVIVEDLLMGYWVIELLMGYCSNINNVGDCRWFDYWVERILVVCRAIERAIIPNIGV